MFSNDKKPGGVSNWFFSLRRQPKKQKSLDSSKLLQKSCVDLTAAGVAASSSEQDLLFRTAKPSKLKLGNNSSNNNNDDTSFTSNSCTNCCCKFSSKTSSPSFGVSPIDDDIEQTDQLRKVLITNEENYSAAGSHENGQKSTNFSSNILLYNKKEEFTRTTRTMTTKVTSKTLLNGSAATSAATSTKNLHHRIGLVFNENGQLLNRRQLLNAKYRDGLIFDENGRLMSNDSFETAPLTPASSILDDSTIEFIDSSTQNSDIQNRANMQHKCSCMGSKMTLTNSNSILSNSRSDWSSSNNNRQVIRGKLKQMAKSRVKQDRKLSHPSFLINFCCSSFVQMNSNFLVSAYRSGSSFSFMIFV